MQRLKAALEHLDEAISSLEDKVLLDSVGRQQNNKKKAELLKTSRLREMHVLATAQKVAARLDQTIHHVEHILRD